LGAVDCQLEQVGSAMTGQLDVGLLAQQQQQQQQQ
jgi:hypothetical protein